jgi:hypothetical protein
MTKGTLSLLLLVLLAFAGIAAAQTHATFSQHFYPPLASGGPKITAADLNGDGYDDILADYWSDSGAVQEYVYLNNRMGAFLAPRAAPGNGSELADMNRDGKLDLVYSDANTTDPTNIYVAFGNGDGTFATPISFPIPSQMRDFVVADLDNDGIPDLALIAEVSTLFVFHNDGTAHFTLASTTTVGTRTGTMQDYPVALAAGDVNGDHRIDLVMSADVDITPGGYRAYVLTNTKVGFTQQVLAEFGGTPFFKMFDIDGDGRADIEVLDGGNEHYGDCCGTSIYIFFPNADGTFTQKVINETAAVNSYLLGDLVVADLNGDGRLDLAAPGLNYYAGQDDIGYQNLLFWYGKGGRNFTYTMNGDSQLIVGNGAALNGLVSGFFTGDNKKDLIAAANRAGMWWLTNTTSPWADTCSYPTTVAIHFCSPGGSSGTSVHVIASSHTRVQPLLRMELWVDGHKRSQVTNDRLDTRVTLPVGTHSITVVSVDATGRYIKSSRSVTVQ